MDLVRVRYFHPVRFSMPFASSMPRWWNRIPEIRMHTLLCFRSRVCGRNSSVPCHFAYLLRQGQGEFHFSPSHTHTHICIYTQNKVLSCTLPHNPEEPGHCLFLTHYNGFYGATQCFGVCVGVFFFFVSLFTPVGVCLSPHFAWTRWGLKQLCKQRDAKSSRVKRIQQLPSRKLFNQHIAHKPTPPPTRSVPLPLLLTQLLGSTSSKWEKKA